MIHDPVDRSSEPPVAARAHLLRPFLLALTVLGGLVDAISFLGLGQVFVSSMTGNVVFLGFAIAGAPDLSITRSATALAAFVAGALGGGALAWHGGHHHGRLLLTTTLLKSGLVGVAVLVTALTGSTATYAVDLATAHTLIVLLATAMGLQNAMARHLALPDETTTVVTITLTGLAADARAVGGPGAHGRRRTTAIAALALGALVGALVLLNAGLLAALLCALALLLVVSGTALWTVRGTDARSWATTAS